MSIKGNLARANLKVSAAIHREIDIESATTGKPIYALVAEAWRAYKAGARRGANAVDSTENLPTGDVLGDPFLVNPQNLTATELTRVLQFALDSRLEKITRDLESIKALLHSGANPAHLEGAADSVVGGRVGTATEAESVVKGLTARTRIRSAGIKAIKEDIEKPGKKSQGKAGGAR